MWFSNLKIKRIGYKKFTYIVNNKRPAMSRLSALMSSSTSQRQYHHNLHAQHQNYPMTHRMCKLMIHISFLFPGNLLRSLLKFLKLYSKSLHKVFTDNKQRLSPSKRWHVQRHTRDFWLTSWLGCKQWDHGEDNIEENLSIRMSQHQCGLSLFLAYVFL